MSHGRQALVSLCMIVRDEERYLGQALTSVTPIADEVIVVDTGSRDRTVEVARAHGATILHFDWVDDFSLARNFSLSHATGKWILILDGDEVLSERDHATLRDLVNDPAACWAFTTRNYSSDPTVGNFKPVKGEYPDRERGQGGYFEGEKVRLFPRDPDIRFEGQVHELVEPSIQRLGRYRIRKTAIPIHHYGHTAEARRDRDERKAQLYRHAGESKILDHPVAWQGHFDLALEYANRKLFDWSLTHFERAAELNPASSEVLANMGYALCELGRHPEAVRTLERALRVNPRDPEAYCNLGVAFLGMGDYLRATEALTRAIEIQPEFVNAYCNFARALLRMGRVGEAVAAYDRTLALYPGYTAAKAELGIILAFLKRLDRAEALLVSVLQDEPRHAAALYNLALIYHTQSRPSDALAALERFLEVSENGPLNARVEAMCRELRGVIGVKSE